MSNNGEDYAVMADVAYGKAQYLSLVVLTLVTSGLSAAGSAATIYLASRKIGKVFQRLVIPLALSDIGLSICYVLNIFWSERNGTEFLAVGSHRSCRALGVIWTTFLLSSILYNASVAVYFYFTICRGTREAKMKKCIEKPLHATVLSLAFGPPFVDALLRSPTKKWVLNCTVGNQTIGIITAVLIVVPMLAAVRLTYLVFRKVKDTLDRSRKYQFAGSTVAASAPNMSLEPPAPEQAPQQNQQEAPKEPPSMVEKETGIQAVSYCLAFLNSALWITISMCFDPTSVRMFPVTILIFLFFPLQGLINFFVYVRPSVAILQSRNQSLGLFQAFGLVIRAKEAEGEVSDKKTSSGTAPISEGHGQGQP